jgi:hypothetical protein
LKISLKPRQGGTWAAALLLSVALAGTARAEQLGYHDIKTDSSGKIVPWYGTGPSQAYDHDIGLLFTF